MKRNMDISIELAVVVQALLARHFARNNVPVGMALTLTFISSFLAALMVVIDTFLTGCTPRNNISGWMAPTLSCICSFLASFLVVLLVADIIFVKTLLARFATGNDWNARKFSMHKAFADFNHSFATLLGSRQLIVTMCEL